MTPLAPNSPVAVLGAGTMGRGIARIAAGVGHPVTLFDMAEEALESAKREIHRYLQRDVEKGRLDEGAAAAIAQRINFSASADAIAGSMLVIEAIIEDLAAKVELLRVVESRVADDAIIATNTSSLSVTAIAAGLDNPGARHATRRNRCRIRLGACSARRSHGHRGGVGQNTGQGQFNARFHRQSSGSPLLRRGAADRRRKRGVTR
jgi:hypothetical protein